MSSGIQHGFQSKAIDIVLNITAISAVVCTLQQLYPSGNNSNFAMAVSSSETILSIMAVGDSIGYNIDSKRLSNLSQIIESPDIFIFNLEGVLTESLEKAKECKGFPAYQFILQAIPLLLAILNWLQ